jgi:hypothetical protein
MGRGRLAMTPGRLAAGSVSNVDVIVNVMEILKNVDNSVFLTVPFPYF